ncbi:MAG: polysaccharide biosynthesis/export family protein [Verrucomicrobiota bacterium]
MKAIPSLFRFVLAALCSAGAITSLFAAQPPPAPKAEKKYVPYRISRSDVISVEVLANGEREYSVAQKRVEATGTVNLLYIQEIRLVGLTIAEAQEQIAAAYRDGRYIRNPVVTVTVETFAPRRVSISGKVNSQATFEIPPDSEMTIMELIFKANGFTDTAKGTAVSVTRTMPDGTPKVYILDVEGAMKGRIKPASSTDASFVLQPDDVVYVPERII